MTIKFISLLLTLGLFAPTPQITAEVTEITNGRAVVDVIVGDGFINDVYKFDFPITENEFEPTIEGAYEGQEIRVCRSYGTFHGTWRGVNYKGETETLYQFKSYNDEVWWAVTEEELGFKPVDGKPYILVFSENKYTRENHKCPK